MFKSALLASWPLNRLKSTGHKKDISKVKLSFPVKSSADRFFPRHQSQANWAPVGDTAAS